MAMTRKVQGLGIMSDWLGGSSQECCDTELSTERRICALLVMSLLINNYWAKSDSGLECTMIKRV